MTDVDPAGLRFGIEAEFALLDAGGRLLDFEVLTWHRAQAVIDRLDSATPPQLTRGDLGIKTGRWYIEGDERFDATGAFLQCVPKGIETRTPPATGIEPAVALLGRQTGQLQQAAAVDGLRLATIGWNPRAAGYRPRPDYNGWERAMRRDSPAFAAPDAYMMSYGPDVNLSHPSWDDDAAITIARRLTAVSPALVPFSFSSPFFLDQRAGVWSVRTAMRTGRRPAVRVFVRPDAVPAVQPSPPLIHPARIPAERGRIEYKAFDAVIDPVSYPTLLALIAGVALSTAGGTGTVVPDADGHLAAARHGFDDPGIGSHARLLLDAARAALQATAWRHLLDPLDALLVRRRTPAHDLVDAWKTAGVVPLLVLPDVALPTAHDVPRPGARRRDPSDPWVSAPHRDR